jgi:30S ribosomal protein S31
MGKGDKKTRRGKITLGSFGVRRPRKTNKPAVKSLTDTEVKGSRKKETREAAAEKEVLDVKETKPVKDSKIAKDKPEAKTSRNPKEKKEVKVEKEPKSKKDKKT